VVAAERDEVNTNQRISQAHEADLQARLGGRRTRGSGNQFNNPMDGRHSSYAQTFAFAWDGKATRSKSVSVTEEMWDKAVEQAHHERPMLALRQYLDDRARRVGFDLAVIALVDLEEMLDRIDTLEAEVERLRVVGA
jgi:hypothetical protein